MNEGDPTSSRLRLVAPLRRTDSGSGTFLSVCSDKMKWWVKAPGNPQGDATLAAEVVVAGIGYRLGAPVRPTSLVEIPDAMTWSYTSQDRLKGGIGHASLDLSSAVVAEEWEPFASRDHNRIRQARLLALWDLCMGGDPQWLFDPLEDYSIWSFDHGLWLGIEGAWSEETLNRIGDRPWTYDLDPSITSAAELRRMADEIGGLTAADIQGIVGRVPVEWAVNQVMLELVADILLRRTSGVAERLRDAANQSSHN